MSDRSSNIMSTSGVALAIVGTALTTLCFRFWARDRAGCPLLD